MRIYSYVFPTLYPYLQVQGLLDWIDNSMTKMNDRYFTDSYEDARDLFDGFKSYLCQEKPLQAAKKLDLESLYASIQTKLQVRYPFLLPFLLPSLLRRY